MAVFRTGEDENKKTFVSGLGAVLNSVPTNEEEALAHGNALAAGPDSNYPVGTSECFNVGMSGGCGPDCFVYQKGECGEPQEMLPRLTEDELIHHQGLYK